MLKNFYEIEKVLLQSRINKNYSSLQKITPFKINPLLFTILVNVVSIFLGSIFFIIIIHNYIINLFQYSLLVALSIFVISNIYMFFNGGSVYKKTHFPINHFIYDISPFSNLLIFILLIVQEIFVLFFKQAAIYLFICISVVTLTLNINIIFSIMFLVLIFVSNIFSFILGNRFFGAYKLYKINNKIGFFRLFGYLFVSSIFFLLGWIIAYAVHFIIKSFRPNINELHLYFDNTYLTSKIQTVVTTLGEKFLFINFNYLNNVLYNYLNTYVLIALTIIFSLLTYFIVKQFHPNYSYYEKSTYEKTFEDFVDVFINGFIKIINKKSNGISILKKDLISTKKNRWLISPYIFSVLLNPVEIYLYLGIVFYTVINTNNFNIIFITIVLFILMEVFVRTFLLYSEYPQVFSLSAEQRNIELILISPKNLKHYIFSKYLLILGFTLIPTIINVFLLILLLILNGFISVIFFIIPLSILALIIAPLNQIYVAPFTSNFNVDHIQEVGNTKSEQDLHEKFQGILRMFIISPIIYLLFMNIFIPIYQKYAHIYIYVYICILFMFFVFLFIAVKVLRKGISHLYGRN